MGTIIVVGCIMFAVGFFVAVLLSKNNKKTYEKARQEFLDLVNKNIETDTKK